MSGWEAWGKRVLVTSAGHRAATHAGIYDLEGNVWFATPGLTAQKKFFDDVKSLCTSGIGNPVTKLELNVGGALLSCFVIQADDKIVIAKKGQCGLTVARAKKCCVVGVYDSADVQPGNNNEQVQKVCTELGNIGY